jgi:sugar transferase EpsL
VGRQPSAAEAGPSRENAWRMADLKIGHCTRRRAGLKTGHYTMKAATKRGMDVVVAALALAVLWPVMLAVGVAIRACDGGPVIFRQRRPGLKGRPFTLLKFRTMREARDAEGRLLGDEARLTALGKVLRELGLDELPQLWNVLRGGMSLVGPRPLLMEYMERYSPEELHRHDTKPGITGWAQVNGRNGLTWPEKFALDLWYVDNWSLWLDSRILVRTLRQVLKREGISQPGHATMAEYSASERNLP